VDRAQIQELYQVSVPGLRCVDARDPEHDVRSRCADGLFSVRARAQRSGARNRSSITCFDYEHDSRTRARTGLRAKPTLRRGIR
jgi:hypothetical protein